MKFLRRPQVQALTGLPCSTIYEMMDRGTFPRPIRLTPRIVGWLEADVRQWQEARLAESGREVA